MRAEVLLQLHLAEDEAANRAEQDTADDVDGGYFPAEGSGKHCHCHLIDERRGDEEREGHAQWNTALDEADKQWYARARAERSDGSEERCQEVLQSVKLARVEEVAESFNREVGIDNAHHYADEEEQQHDFQRVIDEEVERFAKSGCGVYAEEVIDQPICKLLYHNYYKLHVLSEWHSILIPLISDR